MTVLQRKLLILFSTISLSAIPVLLVFIREGHELDEESITESAEWLLQTWPHEEKGLLRGIGEPRMSPRYLLHLCVKAIPVKWGCWRWFSCTERIQALALYCSPTAFGSSLPFLLLIHVCLDLLTWRGRACARMWLAKKPACNTLWRCKQLPSLRVLCKSNRDNQVLKANRGKTPTLKANFRMLAGAISDLWQQCWSELGLL